MIANRVSSATIVPFPFAVATHSHREYSPRPLMDVSRLRSCGMPSTSPAPRRACLAITVHTITFCGQNFRTCPTSFLETEKQIAKSPHFHHKTPTRTNNSILSYQHDDCICQDGSGIHQDADLTEQVCQDK